MERSLFRVNVGGAFGGYLPALLHDLVKFGLLHISLYTLMWASQRPVSLVMLTEVLMFVTVGLSVYWLIFRPLVVFQSAAVT